MNDIPVKECKVQLYSYMALPGVGRRKIPSQHFRTTWVLDIPELFRNDAVGFQKYAERLLGIERRLDKVIRRRT